MTSSVAPTSTPSAAPTLTPSAAPTSMPSVALTSTPSAAQTSMPTVAPTTTARVAAMATRSVARMTTPSVAPTLTSSVAQTLTPSVAPLTTPSVAPTSTAPAPPALPGSVPSTVVGDLNDKDYIRWLKATQARRMTIDVLSHFCDTEMKKLHQTLVGRCGGATTCTSSQCTFDARGRLVHGCPVCTQWWTEIQANRKGTNTKLIPKNADFRQWPLQHWQVAKVYMGVGQDPSSVNAADTDASGVIQLMANCKHFVGKVDMGKVDEVSIL